MGKVERARHGLDNARDELTRARADTVAAHISSGSGPALEPATRKTAVATHRRPAAGGPGVTTTAVEDAAKALDEAWKHRAFDVSTASIVVAGLAAIVVGLVRSANVKVATSCVTACATHFAWSDARFGLVFGSAVSALVLVAVALAFSGRSNGGLVGLAVGEDNRVSTSKTQVLIWTIAIVVAFFFFTFESFRSGRATGFDQLQAGYLLLLGGPFAAAVLASAANNAKDSDGSLQKSSAAAPTASDLTNADDGAVSVPDTQFLLFNLVALTYFVITLIRHPTELPDIPPTLIGLTSVSALTYLGAKVVSSSQPAITSVSIVGAPMIDGRMTQGTPVRILGQNFFPRSTQPEIAGRVAVTFSGVEGVVTGSSNAEILAVVPDLGADDTVIDIIVRTPTGQATAPSRTLSYRKA